MLIKTRKNGESERGTSMSHALHKVALQGQAGGAQIHVYVTDRRLVPNFKTGVERFPKTNDIHEGTDVRFN